MPDPMVEHPHRPMALKLPIIFVAVIALAVAGLFAYSSLSSRRAAVSRLDTAVRLVEEADDQVAEVDRVLSAEVKSGAEVDAEKARGQASDAVETLREAVDVARGAMPDLPQAEQRRARLVQDAAEARIRMMTVAPDILTLTAKAARALPKAQSAWERIVDADKLSERAVTAYNKLTTAGVRESARLNKQAEASLKEARADFADAEDAFPEAALEEYVAYVDARLALNGLSQRSDAAWLSDDIAEANRIIESYNAQDKKAVALAKMLPSSTAAVIAEAYERETGEPFRSYYEARDDATSADGALRKS